MNVRRILVASLWIVSAGCPSHHAPGGSGSPASAASFRTSYLCAQAARCEGFVDQQFCAGLLASLANESLGTWDGVFAGIDAGTIVFSASAAST
jgi:hypothetical protein